MGFYAILFPRPSPAPEDSSCTVTQGYFSVVSRRFYPSEMSIMSQSLLSYLRIDALSPSAPIEASQRTLGSEHPDTLRAMHNLAISYGHLGRRQEAMELREKLLEVSQRTLGSEHPDTLSAMYRLANSYADLGRM